MSVEGALCPVADARSRFVGGPVTVRVGGGAGGGGVSPRASWGVGGGLRGISQSRVSYAVRPNVIIDTRGRSTATIGRYKL